jgi:hypothetical protein
MFNVEARGRLSCHLTSPPPTVFYFEKAPHLNISLFQGWVRWSVASGRQDGHRLRGASEAARDRTTTPWRHIV